MVNTITRQGKSTAGRWSALLYHRAVKMHAGQVELSVEVVAGLVAAQFPQWRRHQPRPVASGGTVNALFRLGEEVVARFPLLPDASAAMRRSLEREQRHARMLAGRTPVPVPQPLGLGAPGEGYPGWWSAYRWIPGRPVDPERIEDEVRFAADLAGFVRALHALDTGGRTWDGRSRGGPLAGKAEEVRAALEQSTDLVDVPAVARAWRACLRADAYAGTGVWLHADLMPGNLLVRDGRLVAVIDIEGLGVGDPAVDLMPAWNTLSAVGRQAYRQALGVDEATWERGRGWAIAQAIIALPYYIDSNPTMAQTARRTLAAALE